MGLLVVALRVFFEKPRSVKNVGYAVRVGPLADLQPKGVLREQIFKLVPFAAPEADAVMRDSRAVLFTTRPSVVIWNAPLILSSMFVVACSKPFPKSVASE